MKNADQKAPTIIDPVLQEQFEIQMRSQYEWQANYTWLYWPFIAIAAAVFCSGIIVLVSTFFGNDPVFSIPFGLIASGVGGILTASLWGGYKTAREMADKLAEAKAAGR